MALVLKDRVKETTASTGTGTVTLAGAVAGFQSFSAVGDGNTTYYAIVDAASGDWEVGIGTYTASGTTLSRTTVLSSSNAGSLVNFGAGTKDVFVTYPSSRSVYQDTTGMATVQNEFNTLNAGTINVTTANITGGTVSTTPTSGNDLVNKTYVDTMVSSGITYHAPVKYEVPDSVGNLNATYNNGTAGVGATLTNAGTLTAFTPDGVTAQVGDRVLVYNQTNAYENGVYTVTVVGDGSTAWVLTRATDADTYGANNPNKLGQGSYFFVTSGNTGAGESYVCNTVGTITFGTTAITFSQFSASVPYYAGTGLTLSPATTFNIANTGVTAASYGTASSVPTLAINAQGQVTSASNTSIAINANQITSGAVTNAQLQNSSLTVNGTSISLGGSGTITAANPNALTIGTGLTGTSYDGSAPTTIALATSGVAAATYGSASQVPVFAVDTYGRVTSVTNTSIAIAAGAVSGLAASATTDTTNASNITSGTLPSGRLSGSYTGITAVGTLTAGTWNATAIGVGYGGTGLTATPTNGQLAIGNGTGYTLATLTAGTNVSISNSAGGITINATPAAGGTVTSVDVSGGTTGLTFSGGPITVSGTITMAGTLGVANGGTGATTLTGYVKGSGTSALTASTTIPSTDITGLGTMAAQNANSVAITGGAIDGTTVGATTAATVRGTTITATTQFTGSGAGLTSIPNSATTATSANTASAIVARDASGNFSAGTITASLSGNATSATTATTATTATNANNVAISSSSTNADYYFTLVSTNTGNLPEYVATGLTANPSTGKITGGIAGGTF